MKSWMFLSTIRCPSPILMVWPRLKNIIILSFALLFTLILRVDPAHTHKIQAKILDVTASLYQICQWPSQKITGFYTAFYAHQDVLAHNERLRAENQSLRTRHHQALALAAENERLRAKLRVINEMTPEFISVRVIGGSSSSFQRNLLLGGGLKSGIQPKSAVLLNHQIVGRITDVGNTSSRVLLITDPHSHIPVILEKSGIQGILSGHQGSIMKIKVVDKAFAAVENSSQPSSDTLYHKDQSPHVQKGEYVFSSGLGGVFPPGHLVGRVVDISLQEIKVETLIDESSLEYVQVAIPYEDVVCH